MIILLYIQTVPPPAYESIFGRVREVHRSSNGVLDFIKNLVILSAGTSKFTSVFFFFFFFSPSSFMKLSTMGICQCLHGY